MATAVAGGVLVALQVWGEMLGVEWWKWLAEKVVGTVDLPVETHAQ